MSVTVIGLPVVAATSLAGRWIGARLRQLANALIGADVPPPKPVRVTHGALDKMRAHVTDGAGWRAYLYLLLKLPVGTATSTAAISLYASGLAGATYWIWRPFAGCDSGPAGTCHRVPTINGYNLDTPLGVVALTVVGVALLSVTPWLIRRLNALDAVLVRALLGA